jgi:hypothetical protein
MDDDLEALTREQLVREVARLRAGIRAHRDGTGHDLCWHHPALWGLLPEPVAPRIAVPEWPQFLEGCIRYRRSLDAQRPDAPRTTEEAPAAEAPRTACLWERVAGTGLERFELLGGAAGWRLRGTLVGGGEQGPTEAAYDVVCDAAWRTRSAKVRIRDGAVDRAVEILADGRRWLVNGREEVALRGAVDVDLEWSPSTNTLPIRRLGLPVGAASGEVVAAWVRFPQLTVEPLSQEYARLADRRWRYTSAGGAFSAALEVDAEGVVVEYEGRWRRPALGEDRR